MPQAEGGCGPDSPAWLYLAKRGRPPLSLRDISPRFAGGEGVRLVQRIPKPLHVAAGSAAVSHTQRPNKADHP